MHYSIKHKKGYNYKPKFKKGDIIIRNDGWYNEFAKSTKTNYVNPYHKAYNENSTLTIQSVGISEFDTFVNRLYTFGEQINCYECKLVDNEYELYTPGMRKNKIKEIKKHIDQNK